MKKAEGSASGLALDEPRSLRSRGCWWFCLPLVALHRTAPLHVVAVVTVCRKRLSHCTLQHRFV